MSFDVGTPNLFIARETRSSKMLSSLSHWPVALLERPLAMLAMRLVASENFSSAAACVLRWIATPSFTSVSNTLPPSSCAFEKAPRPASQICCADSFTVLANCAEDLLWLAPVSALFFVFVTMMVPSSFG